MPSNGSAICTPLMIAFISLGGAFVIGLLGWGGQRMFNYYRTRIICKQSPNILVYLIKRKAFRKPIPMIRIHISNADIFTRQPDGYYWLEGELTGLGKRRTKRSPYKYYMSLDGTYTSEYEPTDWSFWANKAQLS